MQSFVLNDLIEFQPNLRVRKPILKVPTLVTEIVCYDPGQVTATHHHPVQDEIWLVLSGYGEVCIGEERQAVGPSSLIFIPAGVRHGLSANADSRLVLLFMKSPGITDEAALAAQGMASMATPMAAVGAGKQVLQVSDVQALAQDVVCVELRAPGGGELPAFEPGAHVAIDLPGGMIRHYSLCNDWRERDRYVLGIARAVPGRGGSQYMHQSLRRGMSLAVGTPRNGFALQPAASQYLFLAGGIGITPILAMIRWCAANARPWRLVYAARSAQRAAFLDTLAALGGGSVHVHADDQQAGLLDPTPWLAGAPAGEHVYCCGPAPMMAAVERAAQHRPADTVHFEYFNAPTDDGALAASRRPFTVELARSARTLAVPADKTLLQVLESEGFKLVSSCREGTCRTCETRVLAGEVEHRDYCQTAQERATGGTMMVCVSRARGEHLVLDL